MLALMFLYVLCSLCLAQASPTGRAITAPTTAPNADKPQPSSTTNVSVPRRTAASDYTSPLAAITPPPDGNSTIHTPSLHKEFVQTTYYSCVTIGTYSHCGWHEPILDTSSPSTASGTNKQHTPWAGLGAAIGAAVCVLSLLLDR